MTLLDKLLDPQVITAITGLVAAVGALFLHLPQPGYMKKKDGE